MKKGFVAVLILVLICSAAWGASLKTRLGKLEVKINELRQQVQEIEGIIDIMAGTIIPADLDIDMDGEDPSDPGDIKIVRGAVWEFDDCDATALWSVHSGAGVTIELDNAIVNEGTGSIKVTVPPFTTGIVKCVLAVAKDLNTPIDYKYLNVYLRRDSTYLGSMVLYFGENNDADITDEQSKTLTMASIVPNNWSQQIWDISGIADASKNAVLFFAVKGVNSLSSANHYFWIDYIYADPGPASLAFFDGDRLGHANPPYVATWTGNGSDPQTISLPRKGIVKAVILVGDAATYGRTYWATSDMAGYAAYAGAAGVLDSGVIANMGDGTFQVSGNYANKSGVVYYAIVFFAD